jgi:hypothetical protein
MMSRTRSSPKSFTESDKLNHYAVLYVGESLNESFGLSAIEVASVAQLGRASPAPTAAAS